METPLTPLEFGRRARKLYGEREAVIDGDLRMTYEQFFSRCDRWSAALQGMGVKKGDRVAYIAPNTHEMLESFYAVPQIGAVLVPINYRLTPDDFVYIITHSGATVLCVHPDHMEAVDSVRHHLTGVEQFVALGSASRRKGWIEYETALAAAGPEFNRPDNAESDLLTINYTSGTTANPKGVMITHRNAWANVVGTLVHFHITAVGGTHICLPKVEPARVFELIRRENVGWLCAAPTVLIALANTPADVRGDVQKGMHVITAGAAPAAATIERLEGDLGWDVTQVYGLTETAPFITICEPRPEHRRLAPVDRAVIKARTGVELITSGELRVVDTDGKDVPSDGTTLGEIVARGNVIMQGYYNDPEATKKVMGDGWFHTGDAAVLHPDGYVEIRDRIKDVIISGGENISSLEVEGVLLRHPAVQEAAIVGLPHEKWGEAPFAYVVLKPGASATEAELIAFTRDRLAHFKAPHGVTFVSELPKTATGKIQKYVLRKGAAAVVRQ